MEENLVLESIIAIAEEYEMKARILNDYHNTKMCGLEFENESCETCTNYDFCECDNSTRERAMQELLELAHQDYNIALENARESLEGNESAENLVNLARILMDISIHPYTLDIKECPELWEAQYIWLRLYYKTNEYKYFEKARFCDGVRHASVEKINEDE